MCLALMMTVGSLGQSIAVAKTPGSAAASSLPRTNEDRPDASTDSQVHLIYVLPNDGADRSLDTNGTIGGSVSVFQDWLRVQTGGRFLAIDTYQGLPDITFFRLGRTDAEIASSGPYVRDEIEKETKLAGFNAPNKVYAVFYDGSSTFSCGGGAWPPTLPGNVAALYLRGEPPGAPACSAQAFASPGQSPGYWEFSLLHEILHTLGFVATCAPHHHLDGHVSDSPRDLMWAGDAPWDIGNMVLDIGSDDYFEHGNNGCLDLADSPFLIGDGGSDGVGDVSHSRTVSLNLSRHLIAKGMVRTTGTIGCSANAGVAIQKKVNGVWKPVKKVTTDESGGFRGGLRDKPGRYRAVAIAFALDAQTTCLKARSAVVRHRH